MDQGLAILAMKNVFRRVEVAALGQYYKELGKWLFELEKGLN